ncbi:hypothetical protein AJ80_07095 [Polytolypa hystricis UAMH7299]|uniref:Atos-like conserved domain-containing protein n=1 Tax=Polytolypa hystricis (strain UAMH7299) TaxID=1447883 RepID=A0A2B7XRF1_POLH7|nr:hypothetical protein AJ80_07095 [Polytolypa hystricis UAMH7299]
MPIFQDPDRQGAAAYNRSWSTVANDGSDSEDIKSFGNLTESLSDKERNASMECLSAPGVNMDVETTPTLRTSDREELIRSIKRGESPTWVPNRSFEEFLTKYSSPVTSKNVDLPKKDKTPPLLPPAEIQESPRPDLDNITPPYDIERPRSALHSGDFRQGEPQSPDPRPQFLYQRRQDDDPFRTGLSTPWYTTRAVFNSQRDDDAALASSGRTQPLSRSRAPSFGSFSSSYVLKAPTSPLVNQANNPDLDFSPKVEAFDFSSYADKASRRRTLPPETFRPLQDSPPTHAGDINFSRPFGSWKREGLFSYQAHQPRRSLTSGYTLQPASSPQTPFLRRPRGPSLSSDASPLLHASMVGSYEESILRGRMSTSPSKPLNFTAQIGVLGKGNCKSNLRCPAHVTVPFPAVFYSYPTSGSGRSISDDSPSPYVGYIDIEHCLPSEEKSTHRSRRRRTSPPTTGEVGDEDFAHIKSQATMHQELRKREKRSRRSQSPKSPVGGCYRIPQQGQLQIIIKNPNKTAVKLFLVPYDLDGMEPGTKTFIRQRSYSAGPIIDMPLSARSNLGTDRPEASLNMSGDPADKPVLRYLIHLNICCPSKGRFYLHPGIRVVFANRVPDGKEKLRNEIQYPEPRYSPYKPFRESGSGVGSTRQAAGKAARRLSLGFPTTRTPIQHSDIVMSGHTLTTSPPSSSFDFLSGASTPVLERPSVSILQSPQAMDIDGLGASEWSPNRYDSFPRQLAPSSSSPAQNSIDISQPEACFYSKLQKGDAGYGGNSSTSSSSDVSESLLAIKLRGLDVLKRELAEDQE